MNALERASVREDIVPFSDFIGGLVSKGSTVNLCRRCRSLPDDYPPRDRMNPDPARGEESETIAVLLAQFLLLPLGLL
jgi:hypothetical protein